jgi:hypothetical protein
LGLELGSEILTETKIKDFDVASNIKAYILGFDVPIDKAATREMRKTVSHQEED